jgi:hypothetical protein
MEKLFDLDLLRFGYRRPVGRQLRQHPERDGPETDAD